MNACAMMALSNASSNYGTKNNLIAGTQKFGRPVFRKETTLRVCTGYSIKTASHCKLFTWKTGDAKTFANVYAVNNATKGAGACKKNDTNILNLLTKVKAITTATAKIIPADKADTGGTAPAAYVSASWTNAGNGTWKANWKLATDAATAQANLEKIWI